MSTEEEDPVVLETRALMAMREDERFEYVKGVIESLGAAFKEIINQKGRLNQMKMGQELWNELDEKAPELIPPIIYSIKPEYQQTYIKLMKEIGATIKPK